MKARTWVNGAMGGALLVAGTLGSVSLAHAQANPNGNPQNGVNQNGNKQNVTPAATPELSSLVLFGSGAAGLGGYALLRWRTRRRQS
jgi:hypothetical protein